MEPLPQFQAPQNSQNFIISQECGTEPLQETQEYHAIVENAKSCLAEHLNEAPMEDAAFHHTQVLPPAPNDVIKDITHEQSISNFGNGKPDSAANRVAVQCKSGTRSALSPESSWKSKRFYSTFRISRGGDWQVYTCGSFSARKKPKFGPHSALKNNGENIETGSREFLGTSLLHLQDLSSHSTRDGAILSRSPIGKRNSPPSSFPQREFFQPRILPQNFSRSRSRTIEKAQQSSTNLPIYSTSRRMAVERKNTKGTNTSKYSANEKMTVEKTKKKGKNALKYSTSGVMTVEKTIRMGTNTPKYSTSGRMTVEKTIRMGTNTPKYSTSGRMTVEKTIRMGTNTPKYSTSGRMTVEKTIRMGTNTPKYSTSGRMTVEKTIRMGTNTPKYSTSGRMTVEKTIRIGTNTPKYSTSGRMTVETPKTKRNPPLLYSSGRLVFENLSQKTTKSMHFLSSQPLEFERTSQETTKSVHFLSSQPLEFKI